MNVAIVESTITDHKIIKIVVPVDTSKNETISIRKLITSEDEFRQQVSDLVYDYREYDFDKKCNKFCKNLTQIFDICKPKIEFIPKISIKGGLTKECLTLLRLGT